MRRASGSAEALEITLKRKQMEVFLCRKRFRVLVAGRRFGKTYLALVELLQAACKPDRVVWYVAPSYKQAKRIAWNRVKALTRPYWAGRPNETDLSIRLKWGSVIALRGTDQYDSLRGDGLDFVVLDEYASIHPAAWSEVLRPALSDRSGGALFIGTPQGFDHLHERFDRAQGDEEWAAFQFTTEQGENVSQAELASASRELDARSYRQEFQASFETIGSGRVYYGFERHGNVSEGRYVPGTPLIWCLDFNVNPMCSVVVQQRGEHIRVLREFVLADSNTPAACEVFQNWVEQLPGTQPVTVQVYGDASGDNRSSSASRTDWQIVRDFLARNSAILNGSVRVGSSNPPVKDRVNCVNALLCSHAEQRRLQVDPGCKQLIRDFEQVCWKSDGSGNLQTILDKSDPNRTHVSDALGYFIARQFPIRSWVGEVGH